ncbi:MAG TPA: potassium-transporting ATPase subunit KdpC [Acidobacteriaceae bacterium]|jgi:K+-transporting ATPase ATPase C chain|nr:potassium-transporting ATPase subunit KdpC [Acidobacteriaceae bacterium]
MRSPFIIAIRFTIVTTILLGILYPLVVTGLAQLTMSNKANGQLITRDGQVIGSAIIGQSFTSANYFHGRPSAAGNGYDATNSGGSNLAQSNKALVTRIDADVANWQKQNPGQPVPIGLVTTSASGLDPDIAPADALYQVPMVAAARHLPEATVRALVESHIEGRDLGFLGEPRVNVLALNLALDDAASGRATLDDKQVKP